MALPQGVSKATGLQAALNRLRLSPRNTVAVGDAENDHELLRLARADTRGGEVVVTGTPEDVAACNASHTGRFLKACLRQLAAR